MVLENRPPILNPALSSGLLLSLLVAALAALILWLLLRSRRKREPAFLTALSTTEATGTRAHDAANTSNAEPSPAAPDLPWLSRENLQQLIDSPVGPTSPAEAQAYRLARLLVSELLEFSQTEVEEGRRQGDLAERLKVDLRRSREAYWELSSCPDKDFLLQELLHAVAKGRVDLFGL